VVLPRQTPSWIMCTDGRLSACRPHEELLFKRPPYKYVRSSPTVLFMILARKRFRAFFLQNSYRWVGMPDISNVQKSPFLKTKTEKGWGKQQKEGRAGR